MQTLSRGAGRIWRMFGSVLLSLVLLVTLGAKPGFAHVITLQFGGIGEWNYDGGLEQGFTWKNDIVKNPYGAGYIQGHYDIYERDVEGFGEVIAINTDLAECQVLDEHRIATGERIQFGCGTDLRITQLSGRPFDVLSLVFVWGGAEIYSSKGGYATNNMFTSPFAELQGDQWKGLHFIAMDSASSGGIGLLTVRVLPEPNVILHGLLCLAAIGLSKRRTTT